MILVRRTQLPPLLPAQANRHWQVLAMAIGAMALACLLRVEGTRVTLWCLPGVRLPELCGARTLFGVSCPGCGLTRSFVHLAHGRWAAAYRCHRMGWIIALLTAAQVPYRLACLGRRILPLTARQARWLAWGLIGGLLLNWLLGMSADGRVFRL
jgi:hypothetical protein